MKPEEAEQPVKLQAQAQTSQTPFFQTKGEVMVLLKNTSTYHIFSERC